MLRLIFMLLIASNLFSNMSKEDPLDLAMLYLKRTKKYETPGYNKIIQYGLKRTGTTVVFNILRFLFEEEKCIKSSGFCFAYNPQRIYRRKVLKTHQISHFDCPENCVFINIRNPLDTLLSQWRTLTKGHMSSTAKLIEDMKKINALQKELKEQGINIVFLRYEEFENNLDYIFNAIEEAFAIEIDDQDKETMRQAFSKENVQIYTQRFPSFRKWDNTELHGDHIENAKNTRKNKKEFKNQLITELEPYSSDLEEMGYPLSQCCQLKL